MVKNNENENENEKKNFMQENYKIIIFLIWMVTFGILGVIYYFRNKSPNFYQNQCIQQCMQQCQQPMYAPPPYNIQGGNLENMFIVEYFVYLLPIIIASSLTMTILWKYTKKEKCVAWVLSLIPYAPAARFYIGIDKFFSPFTYVYLINLLAFFIPSSLPLTIKLALFIPFGNIMDWILLYIGRLNPLTGWAGDGTCSFS